MWATGLKMKYLVSFTRKPKYIQPTYLHSIIFVPLPIFHTAVVKVINLLPPVQNICCFFDCPVPTFDHYFYHNMILLYKFVIL